LHAPTSSQDTFPRSFSKTLSQDTLPKQRVAALSELAQHRHVYAYRHQVHLSPSRKNANPRTQAYAISLSQAIKAVWSVM